ncbi:MAG: methyl-accepting chemotaxis protein [Bacillota bacterium]
MKFSVKAKIGGGFLIVLMFLAFISLNGIVFMNATSGAVDDVDVRIQRISLDYQMKNTFQGAAMAMRDYMVYEDDKYLSQHRELMTQTHRLVDKRIENSSEQAKHEFEKIRDSLIEYDKQITEKMIPLLKEKNIQEATAIGAAIAPITAEINGTLETRISENEKKTGSLIHDVHNSVSGNTKMIIIFSILAFVSGVILAYFTTRSITRPVRAMVAGVKKLEEGDFTQEIAVRSRDEIGELGKALNRTRQQLKELISEIANSAQILAAQSQQLAASSEEVSATAEEVASTTNEVAAMADKSLENANSTAVESRKVVEIAKSSGNIVKQTIDKINLISDSASKVNNSIQGLGQLSAQIGNITDLITSLADQTNLLALNAAIEAARAGDQGRGFAVVAEEVRKLAEQSSSAAKEIGQLIAQIQSGVDVSISSMNQGALEVSEGVKLASEAGKALQSIIEAISKNIGLVEEIAQGAKQTNDGTQQLSSSNEQITSTVQQVAGATQELSEIASKLQASVAIFRI